MKCFVCIFRVRQNLNKNLSLVDPDPGKCYTRAKKAKCVLCCAEDIQNTSEIQQLKEGVASIEGNWSTETSVLPKQFSFMKRNAQSYVEKPLEKGYKFFFENYVFGVLCLLNGSEVHVKGKCYRSQRKSDRPHDVMVILSLAGIVNKARCSCAAGENGYCNHTMGLLYLIDQCNQIKGSYFPQSWNMHRKPSTVAQT